MSSPDRKPKRLLTAEQKYDLWVRMLAGQVTQAEAGVDRSVISRLRAVAREPRVSLMVDTESPPYAFEKADGVAEISQDFEKLRRVAALAGDRYIDADQADAFGERNSGPGECLVRLRPTSITGGDCVADWD